MARKLLENPNEINANMLEDLLPNVDELFAILENGGIFLSSNS
jgi:hypothetical protein